MKIQNDMFVENARVAHVDHRRWATRKSFDMYRAMRKQRPGPEVPTE